MNKDLQRTEHNAPTPGNQKTIGIDLGDRWSRDCILGGDGHIVEEDRIPTSTGALERAFKKMPAPCSKLILTIPQDMDTATAGCPAARSFPILRRRRRATTLPITNGLSAQAYPTIPQAINGVFQWARVERAASRTTRRTGKITASIPGMAAVSYLYDGDGKRVQKTVGTTVTTYVYDAQGQLAAEYGGPPSALSGTNYLTADHLGSTRLVSTLVNGSASAVARYDYAPFGEELTQGIDGRTAALLYPINMYPTITPGATDLEFTGKERDGETGLDFFGARYLSSAQGRFTSPDQELIDQNQSDPQSWNLYSYVRNNPLRFIDPTGRACVQGSDGKFQDDNSGGQSCSDVDKENKNLQPSATATLTQDELNLMMLQMVGDKLSSPREWADTTRHGIEGAMLVEGIRALPSAIRGGINLFRFWQASRLVPASLEALAAAGGPTVDVVTSQTGAIDASRGLHAGIGEGAEALAKSFQPGGTVQTAKIPEALIKAMQGKGLAQVSVHANGAKEVFFKPEAVSLIQSFFR